MAGAPRLLSASLLPSLVTLGNLACGVGAMILVTEAAQKGNLGLLVPAGWILVLATVLDALDGKLARLTRSTSELGAQLDSLADLVTFGVAPALLARSLVWSQGPELGIRMHPRLLVVAPILYACCAALRLARFNVEHQSEDPRRDHTRFVGLPSPAAAGVPVSLSLFYFAVMDPNFLLPLAPETVQALRGGILQAIPFLLVLLGVLMVSRIPFPHFAAWLMRARHPFQRLAEVTIILLLLTIEPELALVLSAFAFLIVPPLVAARKALRGRPAALRKAE